MNAEKTPLYDCHVEANASMAIFANTYLPMRYDSEKEEHLAVRNAVGLFDVSHMGEFLVYGPAAATFLQKMLTRNIHVQKPHKALYALMLNENAGIIDDLIVYCLAPEQFMLCVNAANIKRDWSWLEKHAEPYENLKISDISKEFAQLALQGPKALTLLESFSPFKMPAQWHCHHMELLGISCLIARTGYTGEDGVEIFVKNEAAQNLWDLLLEHGKPLGLKPCGLAARDSLRLEAGLLLHGSDMDEQTSPLEAGLMFAVDASNDEFIGKNALAKQQKNKPSKKLVGFRLEERGIARHGFTVLNSDATAIGTVCSGSWPPSQELAIGFAYVKNTDAHKGSKIYIDIRNRHVKAYIVGTRFLLSRL